MLSLETDEITGLAPTAAIRTAARLFRYAASSPLCAFGVALPGACLCGLIDTQFWMPRPLSAPLFMLLPGLVLALLTVLPARVWVGIILGSWSGGVLGLALPALVLPAGMSTPLLAPLQIGTVATATGIVAGTLLQVIYLRMRPQMAQRLLVAIAPGAIGAACGAGLAQLLPGTRVSPAHWADAAVLFSAQSLGMLLVAPSIVIWWMAAEGCVLGNRGRRRELAGLVAALVVLTVLSLHHWFRLQHVVGVVDILALLVLIGARYPVRVAAPIASLQFVIFGVLWTHLPASHGGRAPSDVFEILVLNLILLLLLLTILLLSSACNTRHLAEQRLRDYAQRLARTDEERRRDSASAVRESIAQSLVGVRYALNHLERAMLTPEARVALGETLEVVREAEAGADEVLHELGPQGLDDADFRAVLDSRLQRLRAGSHADLDLELELSGPVDVLPVAVRRLAFRIVSELTQNALEHGQPSQLRVSLRAEAHSLAITVRDDGRGFDPLPVFAATADRFRLPALRDRVAAEGGSLTLRSAAGAGCVVDVRVPLLREATAEPIPPSAPANVVVGNFGSRAARSPR